MFQGSTSTEAARPYTRPARAFSDVSLSAVFAGVLGVIIAYASALPIYVAAADAMQISEDMFSSFIMAISVCTGVSCITLSLWFRMPIMMAWSMPGVVLLIAIGTSAPLSEIVGAFLVTAVLMLLIGLTNMFEKLINLIPRSVSAGMMAGILAGFGLKAFGSLEGSAWIFVVLLAVFVAGSALSPRYGMLALPIAGVLLTVFFLEPDFSALELKLATPQWITPSFKLETILSVGAPLLITSLTGQYMPGVAVLQNDGYKAPVSSAISVGSLASVVCAFFGGVTITLAAITAAISTGANAHPDKDKRYIAGVANGVAYIICGIFSGAVVGLVSVLPRDVLAMIGGFALLGAIMAGMRGFISAEEGAQAGLIAFLTTLSGVALFGVGSAFWGVLAGSAAYHLARLKPIGAP